MEIKLEILDKIESNKNLREFPNKPGVYIMYAKNKINLGFKTIEQGEVVYIGKSESSLSDRKDKQHFNSESTGRSTVRRTIGAILKKELNIRCYLRGKGKSKNDSNCYIFDKETELTLTKWMNKNIGLTFYVKNQPKKLETELIKKFKPLLNLQTARHRFILYLKSLRFNCKTEAETNGVLK